MGYSNWQGHSDKLRSVEPQLDQRRTCQRMPRARSDAPADLRSVACEAPAREQCDDLEKANTTSRRRTPGQPQPLELNASCRAWWSVSQAAETAGTLNCAVTVCEKTAMRNGQRWGKQMLLLRQLHLNTWWGASCSNAPWGFGGRVVDLQLVHGSCCVLGPVSTACSDKKGLGIKPTGWIADTSPIGCRSQDHFGPPRSGAQGDNKIAD